MLENLSGGEIAGYVTAGLFLVFLAYKFFAPKKSGGTGGTGGSGGGSPGPNTKRH